MWVCTDHVKEAVDLLGVPHIQKSRLCHKCSFCNRNSSLFVYNSHNPYKFKIGKQYQTV